jgi:hypothetical protein
MVTKDGNIFRTLIFLILRIVIPIPINSIPPTADNSVTMICGKKSPNNDANNVIPP